MNADDASTGVTAKHQSAWKAWRRAKLLDWWPRGMASMLQGDIIIAVNGTKVTGNADLAGILLSLEPGTRVQVTVQRGSSQQKLAVTLGERPTSANG